jgi:hypothetical protein
MSTGAEWTNVAMAAHAAAAINPASRMARTAPSRSTSRAAGADVIAATPQ